MAILSHTRLTSSGGATLAKGSRTGLYGATFVPETPSSRRCAILRRDGDGNMRTNVRLAVHQAVGRIIDGVPRGQSSISRPAVGPSVSNRPISDHPETPGTPRCPSGAGDSTQLDLRIAVAPLLTAR